MCAAGKGKQVTAEAAGAAEIRNALVRLRRTTGLPVAFGGMVEPGRHEVRICELSGAATLALSLGSVESAAGEHQVPGATVALAQAYGGAAQYFAMWVVTSELQPNLS